MTIEPISTPQRATSAVHRAAPHRWDEAPAGSGTQDVCTTCGARRSSTTEHQECAGREVSVQPSPHDYDPMA